MTLSTSDIKKINFKTFIAFAIFTLFLVLANFIYTRFSHGLKSYYMMCAFLYPFTMTVVYFIFYKLNIYSKWPYNFLNAGFSTMAVGSFYHGVIDMAEPGTKYQYIFYLIGLLLIITSIILYIIIYIRKGKMKNE